MTSMRNFVYFLSIFLFAAVGGNSRASDDRVLKMFSIMYEGYIGRPGHKFPGLVKDARPYDHIMEHNSISHWSREEKTRLTFMVLTTMRLGTAGAPEFVWWLGDDAKAIGRKLERVSDKDLIDRFGFSEDRIKHYRFMVDLLKNWK